MSTHPTRITVRITTHDPYSRQEREAYTTLDVRTSTDAPLSEIVDSTANFAAHQLQDWD